MVKCLKIRIQFQIRRRRNPRKKEEDPKKNIEKSYKEHYGKSKEEVDKENKEILDTQKKCLDFVQKHQGHPKVCEWCQKEYKRPDIVWKWNPDEETWYRWYDGNWHYWGPSKDGFTEGGWSWYNGYWHNDGYTFKYEDGKWYRFQDKHWVEYGEKVPVDPKPPVGKKICRPFYKMMKQGFPQSLSSTQVPRCKVGDQIYMWTDEAACKFLGGVKAYQERVVCKSGESHKWKRVVKCVQGAEQLESGGFDYKSGGLKGGLYRFTQCGAYRGQNAANHFYVYLFGQCHSVSTETAKYLFKSPTKITTLSETQMNSCKKGSPVSAAARLYSAQGGALFLKNLKMMQLESQEAFDQCQFDASKVNKMSDEEYAKQQIGDIITA